MKKLTSFAKKNNIFIFSSQDSHRKNDLEFKNFNPHCIKRSRGCKKLPQTLLSSNKVVSYENNYSLEDLRAIAYKYPQVIFEKNSFNVFYNPNIHNMVEVVFPDEIYVYGVATDYCVKEAVEILVKHRFSVYIVEDAVKEIDPKEKDLLFSFWKKKGVKFIETAELIKKHFS